MIYKEFQDIYSNGIDTLILPLSILWVFLNKMHSFNNFFIDKSFEKLFAICRGNNIQIVKYWKKVNIKDFFKLVCVF